MFDVTVRGLAAVVAVHEIAEVFVIANGVRAGRFGVTDFNQLGGERSPHTIASEPWPAILN